MKIALFFSQAATYAITDQWDYYAAREGAPLADRWEAAVASAAKLLLAAPDQGTLCRLPHPSLAGLRWVSIHGFPFRIFYLYEAGTGRMSVVHVLHDRRDIEDLLLFAMRNIE